MTSTIAYDNDLAHVHDSGFGDFARLSAPGLLRLLAEHKTAPGPIVDLGCGSGIWARALVDSGYLVSGVDISPAMIEIARRRVPEARFDIASLFACSLPACRAVTALGEVFNYLFDETNSLATLRRLCRNVFDALLPGGLLIFDIAEPGRCGGRAQSFREAADWACLVDYQHDASNERLTRRIVHVSQDRRRLSTSRGDSLPAALPWRRARGVALQHRLRSAHGPQLRGFRVAGKYRRTRCTKAGVLRNRGNDRSA